MNTNTLKLGFVALAFSASVLMVSCQRDKLSQDEDTEMANDNSLSEFVYDDIDQIVDDASTKQTGDNLGNYKTSSNCAVITHDTLSTPKSITVDFGTTNCLCNDGRYRKGQILITYTGKYADSGSMRNITFNNYHVNNSHIMGSKTVENMGKNANNQTYFDIDVNGLIIKATTGDSIIWNTNRERTWVQGEGTSAWADDIYHISGSGNGKRANGNTWTMNIIQPLVKDLSCNWISAGVIELQPTGKALRTINFGNGNCDNQATVTINGGTYTINLN
jgi:hypothetical protein